ncbi:MAG: HNH endonuclease, partial [Ilumatobacter sp.]
MVDEVVSGLLGLSDSAPVVNIVIDASTFARILAAAGLSPTSVDGLPVDPFTGLTAANTLLEDLMADSAGLTSIRCETDRGVPVHPHDVLRAALAGHVRRVVLDAEGHVTD